MFPAIATTGELLYAGGRPDIAFAVREWPAPGLAHRTGDCWVFWLPDDPRVETGVSYIARYKCVQAGNDDALWEKLVTPEQEAT